MPFASIRLVGEATRVFSGASWVILRGRPRRRMGWVAVDEGSMSSTLLTEKTTSSKVGAEELVMVAWESRVSGTWFLRFRPLLLLLSPIFSNLIRVLSVCLSEKRLILF